MSLRGFTLGLVCFSLFACGGSDDAAPASGAGGSAGMAGAAGAAGGSSCPAGSHAVGSECVSTLAAWSSGPSLSGSRDHHVTFVVDSKYLYAAGGVRDMKTPLSSVERSAIASDGSLGPWEAATQLPEASVGAGLGQVGDTIVVAGGIRISGNSGAPSTRTDVGHASADGSVSWSVGPELSVSRFHAAAVAVGAPGSPAAPGRPTVAAGYRRRRPPRERRGAGGRDRDEQPGGPLMAQGDHGPVAFRNVRITPLHLP